MTLEGSAEKSVVRHRRLEDGEVSLLLVESALTPAPADAPGVGGAHPLVARYTMLPNQQVCVTRPSEPGWQLDAAALVLDIPTEKNAILVIDPQFRRIERGNGDADLMHRVARGIAARRRERARALRRLELPDRLVAFSEELHRASTLAAAYGALATHVARLVGGHTGIVYAVADDVTISGTMRPVAHPGIDLGLTECALGPELRFGGPGLVRADEVLASAGGPFSGLAPLARATHAVTLPYVPLGERGVLFVIERRAERVFEPQDWDLLLSVARLAELALDRIELYNRIHDLSLTDPLTGLANRRKLDVMLEHTFSAARRGQKLSLVMIDLDGFKDYNDEFGHIRGDEILRNFARALREHVRGSDLVVRYGGDEFLIVMAGAAQSDAEQIVARIQATMTEIGFTAGVAEYSTALTSPQELVERADRALYAKRRRGRGTPRGPQYTRELQRRHDDGTAA